MKFFRIIRAILRDVFEESAYERFCTREKVEVSSESYARFLRETEQATQQRVGCC